MDTRVSLDLNALRTGRCFPRTGIRSCPAAGPRQKLLDWVPGGHPNPAIDGHLKTGHQA